ncbi:Tudor and KH domain-containing protein like [Pseudolycoriella hygida]|uniref:Tudor and KH domain-containing protein like n=1 Tax=Pseudolycoriella hygida TaxID=35572 RepID=A0A9Q0RYL6_9DIPT|nr:Tudor and KH domain-containing protein like [Pseudolycoriella hygida]
MYYNRRDLLSTTTIVLQYLVEKPGYKTVKTLCDDFYAYTGCYIPFYELGYRYLTDFLLNIPNVLKTYQPHLLYQPHVYPPAYKKKNYSVNSRLTNASKTLPFPLHARGHGDGKYSSTDSIRCTKNLDVKGDVPSTTSTTNQQNSKTSSDLDDPSNSSKFASTSTVPKQENLSDAQQNDVSRNAILLTTQTNESVEEGKLTFVDNLKKDSGLDSSRTLNEILPPPYVEREMSAEPDEQAHDCCEDCYCSSATEEKLSQSSKVSAIPFLPSEEDNFLDLIDSLYFNEIYGDKIKTSPINDVVKVGSFYEMYVSEVSSPYKFWFQLDEQEPNAVDELQERLKLSYDRYSEDHIKVKHMKKGFACAAIYDNVWHRGEIQAEPIDELVKIFFVDFGTTENIKVEDVCYLLKSFCFTPKLCHRGTLDFVKPLTYRWGLEERYRFIEFVGDRKLVAGITEINQENNSARLYLLDRERHVNINYELVFQGHAFISDPRDRFEPHIAEVRPTFESLERGDYPPLEQNYDIESELQSTIIEGFDYFIPENVSEEEAFQLVQGIRKQNEYAKETAKKRDVSDFIRFFGHILDNPFFNGTTTEKFVPPESNPFLY